MLISKLKATFILAIIISTSLAAVCPTGSALIPNCATCNTVNNNVVCLTCINGYYLASSTCIQCSSAISNCFQCSLNAANQPACNICQTGFGLLQNGLCGNCSAIVGCLTCRVSNYNLQCISCSIGLVLYSAQMQCVPCQIPNCKSCAVNNLGNFTCSSC